jgi:hypothetical protein
MENLVEEELTSGSTSENPSILGEDPLINSEQKSRNGVNDKDNSHVELLKSANGSHMVQYELRELFLVEDREEADPLGFKTLNGPLSCDNGNLAKNGSVADKEQNSGGGSGKEIFYSGKSGPEGQGELKKSELGKLPQKCMGQWDSGLNKMVLTSLQEGEAIQLEKDPITNIYFPCVEKEDMRSENVEAYYLQKGAVTKPTRQRAKKTQSQISETKKQVTKRTRVSPGLGKSTESHSGVIGKRKLVDEDEDVIEEQTKKGRKAILHIQDD